MGQKILNLLGIGALLVTGHPSMAQENRYGNLSGSFETNTIYYVKDTKTAAVLPDDRLGSNNYLKFDYRLGKFAAGLMYEAYLPVLQGFPNTLKESDIVLKYLSFEDFNLSVLVGDFYEQFGNGLIFRAYEERALGLNTSVEGVRIAYNFNDKVMLRGIYGRPRRYMERAESKVRGADLSLNLSSLLKLTTMTLLAEGSYLSKYEEYTGTDESVDASVDAYSLRLNWEYSGFSVKGEYAQKTKDISLYNENSPDKGKAFLLELGYTGHGLGVLASARRLEQMEFRSTREAVGIGEGLNYLPALTRQYTYLLTNLNPYPTRGNGEIGGQVDLYYNFKKGTAVGGKNGMKVALNFSTWYDLKTDRMGKKERFALGENLLFRDINLDVVKMFSRAFRITLLYSMQTFNPLVTGHEPAEYKSNILVGDITWRLNPGKSFRLELQHLWTQEDQQNWAAGLLEFNIAPAWSFFVSDMYNYGDTERHYYNGGFSYARSRMRAALNYGRNRAGYTCAGGICRVMPAYTGLNFTLTASF